MAIDNTKNAQTMPREVPASGTVSPEDRAGAPTQSQLDDIAQDLSLNLQQQLDTLEPGQEQGATRDQLLTDLYTMIGCVRGSIAAMANAQVVISQINWQQWETTRF